MEKGSPPSLANEPPARAIKLAGVGVFPPEPSTSKRRRRDQILRNDDTLNAYRSWQRASWAASWPYVSGSIVLITFGGLFEGSAMVRSRADVGLFGATLIFAGLCFQAVGHWRRARYAKAHPWKDQD